MVPVEGITLIAQYVLVFREEKERYDSRNTSR